MIRLPHNRQEWLTWNSSLLEIEQGPYALLLYNRCIPVTLSSRSRCVAMDSATIARQYAS